MRIAATLFVILAAASTLAARSGSHTNGTITGRVVGASPHALRAATVSVGVAGDDRSEPRTVAVAPDGTFVADGLAPRAYRVWATAPGYVTEAALLAERHFVGEKVTVRLVKGAVITGRVTDSDGTPVVALAVRAIRVREFDGRPANSAAILADSTDDEGVYRIFGLGEGTYVVAAGGGDQSAFYEPDAFSRDAPTYYPSSSRASAAEVVARAGEEATGIDIRYRAEAGHSVAGTVVLADPRLRGWCDVALLARPGGSSVATFNANAQGAGTRFEFSGVGDGDYELVAAFGDTEMRGRSAAQPVTVRGADVAGVRLAVEPLGVVSGSVVLPPPAKTDPCGASPSRSVEEIVLALTRAEAAFRPSSELSAERLVQPDSDGAFAAKELDAGTYCVSVRLPDPALYVAAIVREAEKGKTPKPSDVAGEGVALAAGKAISGLRVVIARGAAALSGRVIAMPTGTPARVALVPAEPESAADALRYFEIETDAAGDFAFENLPPGRYYVAAHASRATRVLDAAARAALRRDAAAGREVGLLPCQRIESAVVTLAAEEAPQQP
jgi:hypothetical protein